MDDHERLFLLRRLYSFMFPSSYCRMDGSITGMDQLVRLTTLLLKTESLGNSRIDVGPNSRIVRELKKDPLLFNSLKVFLCP